MCVPKISRAWALIGLGGWYVDDKRAILAGAKKDGYIYLGEPLTPGFTAIREPGEALLVTLCTEDGSLGEGDCVSVTYAGEAGRGQVFHAQEQLEFVNTEVLPRLIGLGWESFRKAAADFYGMFASYPLHPALQYGISQALLTLAASAARCTVAELICAEYDLPLPEKPVPLGIQTGDDRYLGADRAILKRADVLPHGLFKTEEDFGTRGERLVEYLGWLKKRIEQLGHPDYQPILHFDLYGGIGRLFDFNVERMASFLLVLEKLAKPHHLQIESPVEMPAQEEQVEILSKLCRRLRESGSTVQVIVDEWCNTLGDIHRFVDAQACDMLQIKMPDMGNIADTIEAVLFCKRLGVGAYLGGSCNETVLSAQISAGVALATGADQMLAKPGMGVDEALMVVRNEMSRTLGRIEWMRNFGAL